MNGKKDIRKKIIAIRKSLNRQDLVIKSSLICKRIIDSDIYNKSKVIYCYSSINNEVLLDELIHDVLSKGKILALPKVIDNDLVFYKVDDLGKLQSGFYNILEPVDCEIAPAPDLVITPGVAFTKEGNRLGYGGGYYDRFFAKHPDVYKIGVAFDIQVIDSIPIEEHDFILDKIIYN